ncbi:MAG: hypothetical protein ACFB9M_19555 [Myxococcota bacterium]
MKQSRHPLFLAYSNIFSRSAPAKGLVLTLEDLASAYRQRAVDLDPNTRLAKGETPSEVAARIASVRNSYRLIRDVMGESRSVWVTSGQTDAGPLRFVEMRSVAAPSVVAPATRGQPSGLARGPWTVRPVPGFKSTTPALPAPKHVATLRPPSKGQAQVSGDRETIFRDLMAPPRPLLGRFLVQKGLVTLSQLIQAVHWQRQQRPPVGRIAIEWGILSLEQVIELLRQKEAKTPFCSFSVKAGWMKPVQRIAILAKQRQMQRPIGRYFVEQGILTVRRLDEAAEEARRTALPA